LAITIETIVRHGLWPVIHWFCSEEDGMNLIGPLVGWKLGSTRGH